MVRGAICPPRDGKRLYCASTSAADATVAPQASISLRTSVASASEPGVSLWTRIERARIDSVVAAKSGHRSLLEKLTYSGAHRRFLFD